MSIYFQALTATPLDDVETPTSDDQVEVESSIQSILLPYQQTPLADASSSTTTTATLSTIRALPNASVLPVPTLNKSLHLAFLRKILDPLPSPYVAFDSTRCWLIYWIVHSYYLMGAELPEPLRSQAISTLLHFQDEKSGGFGSGKGQIGHLMASYATILALAIVGGPGPCPDEEDVRLGQSVSVGKGGWDDIDRPLLYRFLLSLKQPDGSFTVHPDGETDIRATYCVTCISLLLGIATPELLSGVGQAIANCQTYEGGLTASSQAFESSGKGGAATLGEAHGGYAFCALASHLSLSIIPNPQDYSTSPFKDISKPATLESSTLWSQKQSAGSAELDLDSALKWAASQQGNPIEGGGFRGRTNKLVDGCYGWFSGGGMFTVLGALEELRRGQWWKREEKKEAATSAGEDWESIDEDSLVNLASDGVLFDRVALQEFILLIAQAPKGGLRDKPGKHADAYHTCYNLSGLSMCQNRVELDPSSRREFYASYKADPQSKQDDLEEWKKCCYAALLGWTVDPKLQCVLGGSANQLALTHPIFNVGFIKVKLMMDWSYNQL